MKKIFAVILVLAMILSLAACQKPEGGSSGKTPEEASSGTNNPSIGKLAKDKWPSSVFEPFGVLEFTAAKDIAVAFDEESDNIDPGEVSVLVNCTRAELIAYVDSLVAKGFHTDEGGIERIKERKWETLELYLPGYGHSYYLSLSYSFENDGTGSDFSYGWDEETYEEVYLRRNIYMTMIWKYDGPSGWDTTITDFEVFGISDADLRPDCNDLDKRIDGVECEAYKDSGTGEIRSILLDINTAFDYAPDEDFFYDYVRKMLEVFQSKDSDGKLTASELTEDWNMAEVPVDVNAEEPPLSVYFEYNGRKWNVMFSTEVSHGSEISIKMV